MKRKKLASKERSQLIICTERSGLSCGGKRIVQIKKRGNTRVRNKKIRGRRASRSTKWTRPEGSDPDGRTDEEGQTAKKKGAAEKKEHLTSRGTFSISGKGELPESCYKGRQKKKTFEGNGGESFFLSKLGGKEAGGEGGGARGKTLRWWSEVTEEISPTGNLLLKDNKKTLTRGLERNEGKLPW